MSTIRAGGTTEVTAPPAEPTVDELGAMSIDEWRAHLTRVWAERGFTAPAMSDSPVSPVSES